MCFICTCTYTHLINFYFVTLIFCLIIYLQLYNTWDGGTVYQSLFEFLTVYLLGCDSGNAYYTFSLHQL